MSPLPSPAPSCVCWAWPHLGWDLPWLPWAQLSWLCPLPAPPWWGQWGQRRPWLCVSSAQQCPRRPCATNTASSTNPKKKNTNSTAAQTSTETAWTSTAWQYRYPSTAWPKIMSRFPLSGSSLAEIFASPSWVDWDFQGSPCRVKPCSVWPQMTDLFLLSLYRLIPLFMELRE